MPGYANPQALNRFSYVLNNPLRYTDPTGHWILETNKPEHEQRRNAYEHAAKRIKKKDPFSTHLKEYDLAAAAYYQAVATEDYAENIQTQLLHLEDKRNNVVTNGWNGVDAAQSVAVDASGIEALGIGAFSVNLAGVIFPNGSNINFSPDYGGGGGQRIPLSDLRPLNGRDINILKQAGFNIHELKGTGSSKYNLYRDNYGNVYQGNLDGSGYGDPLYINLDDPGSP